MEKNEIKEFSKVSWAVFLFTITVVLISLVSVVFPALFTETFFQNELDGYGISEHFSLNPFEIGGLALPLVVTNIIIFGMFYFFKKRELVERIDYLRRFKISRKISIIIVIIIILGYSSVSVGEIQFGKNVSEIGEIYGDWDRLKHKLSNMENIWPEEVASFEPHVKHSLLKISEAVFGNFFVIPFLSSIGLLIITYLFTSQVAHSRLAGLISMLLVLQSNLFLTFDTSAAFSSFWIFFYLLSLYLAIKVWPLSPIFYIVSIFSKTLTLFFGPMSIFFVLNSNMKKQQKIIVAVSILIIIIIGITISTTQTSVEVKWSADEFWLGFSAFAFQMRLDSIFVLFLLPLIVGLFIITKTNRHANSLLILLAGTLLSAPFVTGLTDQTNQPYRFLPFIVFFSISVGMIFTNRKIR